MIDRHFIARAWAVAAAVATPLWLLRATGTPSPPPTPTIVLATPSSAALPTRALLAPPPVTGESAMLVADGAPLLIGIVGRPPEDMVALLRLANGTTHGVAPGGVVDGWRVAAIGADRVRLSKSGRAHVAILPPAS